jgi:hypothetical protein
MNAIKNAIKVTINETKYFIFVDLIGKFKFINKSKNKMKILLFLLIALVLTEYDRFDNHQVLRFNLTSSKKI